MADGSARLIIDDLRGGRDGTNSPLLLPDHFCAEAINIDWYNTPFGRKRNGLLNSTATGDTFTGTVSSIFRHVPSADETLAEMWGVDDAATPIINRLAGGTVWSAPTLKDNPTGNGWDFSFTSLNGKLHLGYKSAVARAHTWDTATVRRMGLAAMGAFTAANQGVGAYPATLRYYRTRATTQAGGITTRRSEPTASQLISPSGVALSVRITQGTPPNEGETHWEVEGSLDDSVFYRLATVVIGTTTYDDSALTTTYSSNPLSASIGTYSLPPSGKFLASDQGRLLMFGSWTTPDRQHDLVWSAVIGELNITDDERFPSANRRGLNEKDSGEPTGLVGPVNGVFFAFKYRAFYSITPTGDTTTPYAVKQISNTVGAISHHSIKIGEDELGNPTIYWMSYRGPYRYGPAGLTYLGKGQEDKTQGANGGVKLSLDSTHVVAHSTWHATKRQMWMWAATDGGNDPNLVFTFTVGMVQTPASLAVPSGFALYTGELANARCSCLFSITIGASMSRELKPYINRASVIAATTSTFQADADAKTVDGPLASTYTSSLTTKMYALGGLGYTADVTGAVVVGKTSSATTTFQFSTITDSGVVTSNNPNGGVLTASGVVVDGTASSVLQMIRVPSVAATAGGTLWAQFKINDTLHTQPFQIDFLIVSYKKGPAIAA